MSISDTVRQGNDLVQQGAIIEEARSADGAKFPRSKRAAIVMVTVTTVALLQGTCYALLAPFFPLEAERKGNRPSQYSLVLGVSQLVSFLMSPVYGKLLSKRVRAKTMLWAGTLVNGIFSCLMGLVVFAPPGNLFFGLALAARALQYVGGTAALNCVFATVCAEFPSHVQVLFPLVETSLGLGLILGPSIGGFLYELGGFVLPFALLGSVFIALAISAAVIFPEIERVDGKATVTLKDVYDWRLPANLVVLSVCFLTLGLSEATLTHHLRQFDISPAVIGLIFMISGLSYSLACFAFGQASKRVADPRLLCVIGSVCLLTSFTLIGPLPFINLAPTVGLTCICQILSGAGVASHNVCTFMHSTKHVVEYKRLPNSLPTFALLYGWFSSAISLGLLVGPIIGGILLDNVGYRWATAFVVCLQAAVIVLLLVIVPCDRSDPGYLALGEQAAGSGRTPRWSDALRKRLRRCFRGDGGPTGGGALLVIKAELR